MTIAWHQQLWLLLVKNFKHQFRRKLGTLLEIGVPIVLFAVLIGIRTIKPSEVDGPFYYEPVPLNYELLARLNNSQYQLPNLKPGHNLYYAPAVNGSSVQLIMEAVASKLNLTAVGFLTEAEMVSAAVEAANLTAGVYFKNAVQGQLSGGVEYEIRYKPKDAKWQTRDLFPFLNIPGPRDKISDQYYLTTGFVFLQTAIDEAIIRATSPEPSILDSMLTFAQLYPYPQFTDNEFAIALKTSFPLFMVLAWVYTALTIIRDIVHEKELRLNEAMQMMGLSNWVNWLGWFLKCLTFMLITVIIMTAEVKAGKIIEYSDASVVFVFFLLYVISVICFCFMASTFFNNGKVAAAAGGVIFFLTYVPFFFLWNRYDQLGSGAKYGTCILMNTCMAYGLNIFSNYEAQGLSLDWAHLNDPGSYLANFALKAHV
eukprot:Colp12_sorted_trinity150504_noHs@30077